MAIEKSFDAVSQPFTANGTVDGIITVADASGFFAKQKVTLRSSTQPPVQFEVRRVTPTTIQVGVPGSAFNGPYANVSAYTVADSAEIIAPEQIKPTLKPDEIIQAVYARDPAVALRTLQVNKFGQAIDTVTGIDGKTRLAVDAAVTVSGLSVDLDALLPGSQTNPDNVLIAGSDDGSRNGPKRAARVDSDFDLRVGISDGANKANVSAGGELSVTDAATQSQLTGIQSSLASIDAGIPGALGQQPMAGSMPVVIASDQTPVPVSLADEPIKISGTEDGSPTGTEFTFVNNRRLQILGARDRTANITYADFGTKDQRVTQIDYTAPSIGVGAGFTARLTLSYTLVGNRYRRDSLTWSII
jgi:hypothetical protein